MKKTILSIALLSALSFIVNAEEGAPKKAAPKEHHMQNTNPSATEMQAPEVAAPEHTMQNSASEAKPKAPEHTMKNN